MRVPRWVPIVMCVPLLAVRGHEVVFTSGQSSLCVPFDGANRHVAFQGSLNGREGMRLVLDTGSGGMVIDAARADAFGLEKVGEQHAHGSGGVEIGSIVRGVDVALPGVELVDQTMGTLNLTAISAQSGLPMDAILGHPFLSRSVVEIDYPRKCVSFFDPAAYKYSGPGVSVPITFKQDIPYVKASVVLPDGRSLTGKFLIDTGASTNVALSPELIARKGVSNAIGKTLTVHARGVGGVTEIRLARLARLELGGFTLQGPVAALQPAGAGRISAEGTVGNIGGGILSRFKVILDYPHRRIILEPGPDLAVPFEADMSGLGLVSVPPDLQRVTVARVLDDSPASEAGLRPGDEIQTVNGKPIGEIGLPALRETLRLDGQDVKFTVIRGSEPVTVELKTRRMI